MKHRRRKPVDARGLSLASKAVIKWGEKEKQLAEGKRPK